MSWFIATLIAFELACLQASSRSRSMIVREAKLQLIGSLASIIAIGTPIHNRGKILVHVTVVPTELSHSFQREILVHVTVVATELARSFQ
jgi:hypothetical protein